MNLIRKIMDNLNEFLQPLGAPVSTDRTNVNSLEFSQNYQLPLNSINNTNTASASRAYTAIVSLSGETGTFKDIQLAINYVNSLGGGTVLIRRGKYVLSAIITMYSNIYIVGEDAVNTIIDCNASNFYFSISGLTNVQIRNLKIQNGQSTSTVGTVYITNSSKIKITGVNFLNNATGGDPASCITIFVDNTGGSVDQLEVTFCTSSGDSVFVYLKGNSRNCWFENNNIMAPVTVVFNADSSAGGSGFFNNNVITNCILGAFYGKFNQASILGNRLLYTSQVSTDYLIDLTSGAGNIEFANNHISVGGAGAMRLTNVNNMAISGNILGASTGDAININSATSVTVQITGNVLRVTTAGIGINASNASLLTISGNSILAAGNNKDGIKFTTVTESTIVGNVIYDGAGGTAYAVNISDAGSNSNAVVGNRLRFTTAATHDLGSGDIIASNA